MPTPSIMILIFDPSIHLAYHDIHMSHWPHTHFLIICPEAKPQELASAALWSQERIWHCSHSFSQTCPKLFSVDICGLMSVQKEIIIFFINWLGWTLVLLPFACWELPGYQTDIAHALHEFAVTFGESEVLKWIKGLCLCVCCILRKHNHKESQVVLYKYSAILSIIFCSWIYLISRRKSSWNYWNSLYVLFLCSHKTLSRFSPCITWVNTSAHAEISVNLDCSKVKSIAGIKWGKKWWTWRLCVLNQHESKRQHFHYSSHCPWHCITTSLLSLFTFHSVKLTFCCKATQHNGLHK